MWKSLVLLCCLLALVLVCCDNNEVFLNDLTEPTTTSQLVQQIKDQIVYLREAETDTDYPLDAYQKAEVENAISQLLVRQNLLEELIASQGDLPLSREDASGSGSGLTIDPEDYQGQQDPDIGTPEADTQNPDMGIQEDDTSLLDGPRDLAGEEAPEPDSFDGQSAALRMEEFSESDYGRDETEEYAIEPVDYYNTQAPAAAGGMTKSYIILGSIAVAFLGIIVGLALLRLYFSHKTADSASVVYCCGRPIRFARSVVAEQSHVLPYSSAKTKALAVEMA
jgi:hypothetical protein